MSRLNQAVAQVLSRQDDSVGDEHFHLIMDGSAWKELWAAYREETGQAAPAVVVPDTPAPEATPEPDTTPALGDGDDIFKAKE